MKPLSISRQYFIRKTHRYTGLYSVMRKHWNVSLELGVSVCFDKQDEFPTISGGFVCLNDLVTITP